ncbi:hypothetical protein [Sediminispirochaeta bajacaliforniensis]|uniref:hypothetical protein n=1 Tax=Sediminispirochaeta bajacaliforniensis TaxID=148 RepID=UPI00037696C5|nr:hypothetical protein [Sediminispirochaeta bajacaliforniensis]
MKIMRNRRLLMAISIILFFFTSLSLLSALELKDGRIKLVLNENNGKFAAYYEKTAASGDYIPFFFARDPRTTGFGFLVGNRIYSMGESSGFSLSVGKEAGGGYFLWKSNAFTVKEAFRFVESENSPLSDGFAITISITNITDRPQTIGVHYLFDTYLGEENSRHFVTDGGLAIQNETEYTAMQPGYWVSPSEISGFGGLQGMVQGRGLSVPDRIVFANWKRLQENTWNFSVQSSRNFNMLPYSVNDSAVCYYYLPKKVAPGEKRDITLAFGLYSGSRFSASAGEKSSDIEELYNKTVDMGGIAPDDTRGQVTEDLATVDDLIDKIDELLTYPESVNEEDIEVLHQIFSTLDQRKATYERR